MSVQLSGLGAMTRSGGGARGNAIGTEVVVDASTGSDGA